MENLIIFDLDGTLYQFKEGNFVSSRFYQEIKRKAYNFLSETLKISLEQAIELYQQINKDFNGEISLGVERRCNIDRYHYFANTWNLDPKDFIQKNDLLLLIKPLRYRITFLTSAPKIWAASVLTYFNLREYLPSLYTGESDIRKPNILAFQQIYKDFSFPCLISLFTKSIPW